MIGMIVGAIVVAWIVFSALLVTIICMNSSRISRLEERQKSMYMKLFGVENGGDND